MYIFCVGLGLFVQVDAETGQHTPFVQLLHVDTCSRIGPAIPIRLSTSMNSSIILHPDGSNETVGDISVQPLPCNDNHTQVYRVSVSSAGNYSLYGQMMINSLLPVSCIFVPVSGKSSITIHFFILFIIIIGPGL